MSLFRTQKMKFSQQNNDFRNNLKRFAPETIIRAAILFICMFSALLFQLPFYGDHVTLISQPAHFYYENGFSNLYLPDDMATGHPPLYPMLTAFFWLIFGKSLWVSHALTLIFGIVLLAQFYRFVKSRLPAHLQALVLLLMVFNPVFLAQMANMSIDILLTALFFMGLNAIHENKKNKLLLAVGLLSLLSLRGFILIGILMVYDMYNNRYALKACLYRLSAYAMALLPVSAYFIGQYLQSGWWLMPIEGNWSADRNFVTGITFLGKSFEFGLRLVEFGMLIPTVIVVWHLITRKKHSTTYPKPAILVISLIVFGLFLLPFTGPILIRYLLPVQMLIFIYFAAAVSTFKKNAIARACYIVTILLMVAQHFFVYPQMKRSIFDYSWGEGSLAHLAYFNFRAEGQDFLNQQKISNNAVYTEFPDYKPFRYTNLAETDAVYHKLTISALDTVPYIIYCNNMNDLPYSTVMHIKQNFIPLKTWYQYPIEYTIYKNMNLVAGAAR